MPRANIEIEGDCVISRKESILVEFLKGNRGTAHLTQLGSKSLPDTSMAGVFFMLLILALFEDLEGPLL